MSNLRLSGGVLVFLGALFWSLNSPLVKFLTLDPIMMCGLRSLIAAVALAAFIRPKRLNWNGWMLLYVCSYASLCLSIIVALKIPLNALAICKRRGNFGNGAIVILVCVDTVYKDTPQACFSAVCIGERKIFEYSFI